MFVCCCFFIVCFLPRCSFWANKDAHIKFVCRNDSIQYINKCIGDDTKAAAHQSPICIKKQNNKIRRKRFSIWRMELLHPAMWHMALESWQWIHQVAAACNVIRGSGMTCHWIRPVAAPCNVAGGSGMTCHWIRPDVRYIGILHLVSISTTSSQSTCQSALVS